jgi:hypothetical protein
VFVNDVALERHEIDDSYAEIDAEAVGTRLRAVCSRSQCVQVKFSGDGMSYVVTLAMTPKAEEPHVVLMDVDVDVYE